MIGADVLVVDDAPTVASALAFGLTGAGAVVRVATSVDAALVELARRPDVAVVDYYLDRDAAMFRLALVRARVPTLLVSGLDDEAARSVAAAHGWSFLPKPIEDGALVAAVAAALLTAPETPPMPEAPTAIVAAAIVPAAPAEALPPPPPLPTGASGAPPHVDPRVQVADIISRRILRGVTALLLGGLTFYGMAKGHPVDGFVVGVLGALGVGPDAVATALRGRPAAVAGASAVLTLALVGSAVGSPVLGAVAATVVAAGTALAGSSRA